MQFLKWWGDEIVRLLAPKKGDMVLDVAAGTGEPGLAIAAMIGNGTVVITDLSDGMLETAKEKVAATGIANVQLRSADATALPFEDNTFDAISCRFGFMFFPDMQLASNEFYRVLKPGGRIAVSVWNKPERNFWVMATTSTLNRELQLSPPPTGAPGMFRCAEDGLIASLFKTSGFTNIKDSTIIGELEIDTMDRYWEFMSEVITPVVAALSGVSDEVKAKLKQETVKTVNEKFPDGNVVLEGCAAVIYGEK